MATNSLCTTTSKTVSSDDCKIPSGEGQNKPTPIEGQFDDASDDSNTSPTSLVISSEARPHIKIVSSMSTQEESPPPASSSASKMPPLNPQTAEPIRINTTDFTPTNSSAKAIEIGPFLDATSKTQGFESNIPIGSIAPNDVLFGRGGGTNRHNAHFRQLVSDAQPQYVQARKRDKTNIAKSIVATIRSRNGRFLKLNPNGFWSDVGDKKATEKTSQALREGLSGRMREIVTVGGVGVSQLKRAGIDETTMMGGERKETIEGDHESSSMEENTSKKRKTDYEVGEDQK